MPKFLVIGDIERAVYEPLWREIRHGKSGLKIVHMPEETFLRKNWDLASLEVEDVFKEVTNYPIGDFFGFVMTSDTYHQETADYSIRTLAKSSALTSLSYGYVLHPDGRIEVVLAP